MKTKVKTEVVDGEVWIRIDFPIDAALLEMYRGEDLEEVIATALGEAMEELRVALLEELKERLLKGTGREDPLGIFGGMEIRTSPEVEPGSIGIGDPERPESCGVIRGIE